VIELNVITSHVSVMHRYTPLIESVIATESHRTYICRDNNNNKNNNKNNNNRIKINK